MGISHGYALPRTPMGRYSVSRRADAQSGSTCMQRVNLLTLEGSSLCCGEDQPIERDRWSGCVKIPGANNFFDGRKRRDYSIHMCPQG